MPSHPPRTPAPTLPCLVWTGCAHDNIPNYAMAFSLAKTSHASSIYRSRMLRSSHHLVVVEDSPPGGCGRQSRHGFTCQGHAAASTRQLAHIVCPLLRQSIFGNSISTYTHCDYGTCSINVNSNFTSCCQGSDRAMQICVCRIHRRPAPPLSYRPAFTPPLLD